MSSPRSRRAAEIQDAIRSVLLREWDPLGVGAYPLLTDEYDAYLAPVYRVLVGSRSEHELAWVLVRGEQELLGQPASTGSAEPLRALARSLLALDVRHTHPVI